MEQRRFILFISLSALLLFGWLSVGPKLVPQWFPKPPPPQVKPEQPAGKQKTPAQGPSLPIRAPRPREVAAANAKRHPVAKAGPEIKVKQHAVQQIRLGSLDPKTGYFLHVVLSSKGAAVEKIELNDPRYRTLADRYKPLVLVGATPADERTLDFWIPAIDEKLDKQSRLRNASWKAETRPDESGLEHDDGTPVFSAVKFSIRVGDLEIRKAYRLEKVPDGALRKTRDATANGYQLRLDLQFVNHGRQPQEVAYTLQGPVGLPLEDADASRTSRDVRTGFLADGGGVTSNSVAADTITEAGDNQEQWRTSIAYIGVGVQYFAALLVPGGDQAAEPYTRQSQAVLIHRAAKTQQSDVSVVLLSRTLSIEPGDEPLEHNYKLFAGPKRESLLEDFGASAVVDFGWLGFLVRGMLFVMNLLHNNLWIPYGLAIIGLTAIVRGMMFPLSKKQARSTRKMKELQPHIAEIRKKYAGEREKLAKAQMALFAKHGYNPLAGCLPLLLQLPIFFALYRTLNLSVDLRMAQFLWIDNLAAPDRLFNLPFTIPLVGWKHFNLLPILTVVLFVWQQKMMMPPPTDDQQAMQHKIMRYMSIFFGFLFYNVPAGLCLYFIASSLWGMGERKLLDAKADAESAAGGDGGTDDENRGGGSQSKPVADGEAPKGLWGRLLAKADEAAGNKQRTTSDANGSRGQQHPGQKKRQQGGKKKKRRSRR